MKTFKRKRMEDLLETGYLGITDANAEPMSDVFTREPNLKPYTAIVPGNLCQSPTDENLVPACKDPSVVKTAAVPLLHDKDWWTQASKGFFFAIEDQLDSDAFNRIFWTGIKGENIPYPRQRSRADLTAKSPSTTDEIAIEPRRAVCSKQQIALVK